LIFREVEDRDLILSARRGDVDAFNALVSRWEKRVFNYLLRLLQDREDALDLSQETFLKAYRGLARLDDVERFPQWLFRIAHNEAISLYRRNRPTPAGDIPDQPQGVALSVAGSSSYPVETSLAVRAALDRLAEEQREVVVLKVFHGFKFHEIADIVGSPVSTVKSRLYSGFEALKRTLTVAGSPADPALGPGGGER